LATRIKLVTNADVDSAAYEDVGDALTPPNGLRWTLVEFSMAFGPVAAPLEGQARIKFDEEIYYEIDSALHNTLGGENQKNREIVAIDVIQPHKLTVQAIGDVDNMAFDASLTIEESAVTG